MSFDAWALDLGTTNTILARWDAQADRPRVFELPAVCREPGEQDPLQAPRAVPSAVHVFDRPSLTARWTRSGWLARRMLLGHLAHIGRPALKTNAARLHPGFAFGFKRQLARSPLQTLARANGQPVSAREVLHLFLRELLAETKRTSGHRIRDLVITSPVEAFETYRAELLTAGRDLGIERMRFLDEPVAAALGYGVGLERPQRVLVVDFGGGTLDLALVELGMDSARSGTARVLAKAGRPLGGDVVDSWLAEEVCRRGDYAFIHEDSDDARLWRRLMMAEACRVKEALYLQDKVAFDLQPPDELRRFEARLQRKSLPALEFARAELEQLLVERGLYTALEDCLREVLSANQLPESAVEQVLMVGGSTLLPRVYSLFEDRFGRDRVRAWQPFEAVAYGACVFAADRLTPSDFIVHDYALMTYDRRTQAPEYTVVVPRGTRFPTAPDLWKRSLVPTCSMGDPETIFKLVICELGLARGSQERQFAWDGQGQLHSLGGKSVTNEPFVVKLNEANPALGHLDPPHQPEDRRPRLEVSLGVNADRWLCATVLDLASRRLLMNGEPVVRLQ